VDYRRLALESAAMPHDLTVPETFEAAVLREANGPFALEQVRLSPPRADEVVVKLVASGVCHTDISVREGKFHLKPPVVLGHEGSGVVVAVGDAVRGLAPGDHMVMTYMSCGECRECQSGQPASCAKSGPLCFSGGRPDGSHALCGADGGELKDRFFGQSSFARYAIGNVRNTVKVRADAPLELLGPLGCGLMTGAGAVWNELKVTPGSSLVVYGAGAVGLAALMAAKAAGAATLVAVDRVASRLELARELGATHVFEAGEGLLDKVREATGGAQFAIDTTGRAEVIREMMLALGQRGSAAMITVAGRNAPVELDAGDMLRGCKSLRGVIEGGGSAHLMIPAMLDLYLAGRFPFDRLVRFYRFDQIDQAVADSLSGETIKPILRMED
jgi:aryl-alcohol dehydrogenase